MQKGDAAHRDLWQWSVKSYAFFAAPATFALAVSTDGCGGLGCCGAAFSPLLRFLESAAEAALPALAKPPISGLSPLRRDKEAGSVGRHERAVRRCFQQ